MCLSLPGFFGFYSLLKTNEKIMLLSIVINWKNKTGYALIHYFVATMSKKQGF